MEEKKESKKCEKCGKSDTPLLKCACSSVFYCGRDCQRLDWKDHKNNCSYHIKQQTEKIEAQKKDAKESEPNKAENYKKIRKVGDGNFSEIWLVEKNDTKEQVALKIINRQRVTQLHKEKDVMMEVHCLTRLEGSEYVIKFFEKFKDDISLYLVMEYVACGELWEKLRSFGFIANSLIKYFFAHVVKAVEFLHSKGIVHRDLKPENIMVDTNNKIKLIDFGTARDLENPDVKGAGNGAKGKRIFDHFVGTPQYMAPECVRNRDSNKKSDVWSLGCLLYQFIAGYGPYLGGSEYLVFTKSLEKQPIFDKFLFSDEAEDLITLMLDKDFTKRIELEEVKKHAYFADVDFENMKSYEEAEKEIQPFEADLIQVKEELLNIQGNEQEVIPKIIEENKKKFEKKYENDEEIQKKGLKWIDLMKKQALAHYHHLDFEWHN